MLHTPRAMRGMVVAPHHLAAQAGLALLREGGNAIEATLAAAAAIAVVYPHMNSIGGDNFWLIAEPGREPIGILACGGAGEAATVDSYRDRGCAIIPPRGPLAANTVAGATRLHIGDKLGLIRKGEWQFMWLVDPPLFEIEDGHVAAAHHPFTSPRVSDEGLLETAPEKVLARAYDLVLNGVEVGGGSIRIHRSDLQDRAFKALGISEEERRAKFGFLLDAFKYGPPPHGGIAFGLDRLSMLMTSAESLRDVIAFPKTQKGSDLMTECPTSVSKKQLDELFIQLRPDLPTKQRPARARRAGPPR